MISLRYIYRRQRNQPCSSVAEQGPGRRVRRTTQLELESEQVDRYLTLLNSETQMLLITGNSFLVKWTNIEMT